MQQISQSSQPDDQAYLHLQKKGIEINIEGQRKCTVGYPLESSTARNNPYEGIYTTWEWDGEKLKVNNDRYGIKPLFYLLHENEIIISSSIVPILRSGIQLIPDYPGLSVFLRLGYFVGNDTPFRDVKLLPPNSTLYWTNGKLSIESGNIDGCFQNQSVKSYEEALEGYRYYFSAAIRKRSPENEEFILPLSGGRDSRHILFELYHQGFRPERCVTLQYRPPATNEDERIARLICDRLHLNHDIVEHPKSWFDAVFADLSQTNYCGGGHSWVLPLLEYYVNRGQNTLYDGLAGDVISTGHTLNRKKVELFLERDYDNLAVELLNEASYEAFNRIALKSDFYREISFDAAVEHLKAEIIKHENCNNPALSYTFWNRTRRAVASIPYSIFSSIQKVHCPFIDHDFFDFCTGIPNYITMGTDFHDDVIRTSYPCLADIPYENKSKKSIYDRNSRRYYRKSVIDFTNYVFRRGFGKSTLINETYLARQVIKDLLTNSREQPWYLRRALYLYELEKQFTNV
ncbi:hypothetical protein [Marinobacterium rhizophilum]|uniref:hypothetical protein n=1 Tax=Marinobacterium rhizophilum TaxID=420402 RepID=UPI000380A998|nr:hypothetical protein [Marinobacterium rhizophilum]